MSPQPQTPRAWGSWGHIVQVIGLTIRVSGLVASIGDFCYIESVQGDIPAEVIGFHESSTLIMPLGSLQGIRPGTRVRSVGHPMQVAFHSAMRGRLLNGLGHPLDGQPVVAQQALPIQSPPKHPLDRTPIRDPLWTGIRVIDGFLTLGRGQRIGIFAGSGVGKSTLLKMLLKGVQADAVVVGLIGERGREVAEFWHALSPQEKRRTLVVASTSDEPPLLRVRAAWTAMAMAESLQRQGQHVLLVLDSLTRVAMAQREIGIATDEPPTSRGYTPSVFTLLPNLLERAGVFRTGSITGCYTVLVDGDDLQADPIADTVRGILDGHWVLSRAYAESGQYPAVDVLKSLSRTMDAVIAPSQREAVATARAWLATDARMKDMVELGAYRQGTDPHVDLALNRAGRLREWLKQSEDEVADIQTTLASLDTLVNGGDIE